MSPIKTGTFQEKLSKATAAMLLLQIVMGVMTAIVFSISVASDMRANERTKSLETFAYSLSPLVQRFELNNIEETLKKIQATYDLKHIRVIDAFGGEHVPERQQELLEKPDLSIPLESEPMKEASSIMSLDIWWGADRQFLPVFLNLLIYVTSFIICAVSLTWFVMKNVLNKSVVSPIKLLHQQIVNRDFDLKKLDTNETAREFIELSQSYQENFEHATALAKRLKSELKKEEELVSAVSNAFLLANMSIFYSPHQQADIEIIGYEAPKTIHNIIRKTQFDVKKMAQELENDPIGHRTLSSSERIKTEDVSSELIFGFEIVEGDKTWNSYGISFEKFGAAIVNVDVSNQKQMDKKLWQKSKLESLGRISSGVAHDMNNILATVMGAVELEKIAGHQSQNLDISMHALARGERIVKQLLATSRDEQIDYSFVEQSNTLDNLRTLFRSTTPANIHIAIEAKSEKLIYAEAHLLETMLINLTINAMDSMNKGGEIRIVSRDAKREEIIDLGLNDGQTYVALDVCDQGEGIPNHVAENMFDPFFSTKPVGKGTGLGLAMAYNFVEKSGGRLTFETELGVGTRFSAYFPSKQKHTLQSVNTDKLTLIRTDEAKPFAKKHILLVEDEIGLRKIYSAVIKSEGFECISASNYKDALSLLDIYGEDKFVAVFTDMYLPDGDGLGVLEQFQGRSDEIFKVLMSGNFELSSMPAETAKLFDRLLVKPFSVLVLQDYLRDIRCQGKTQLKVVGS